MLLIWDIHINTRFQDKILTQLNAIFAAHPDEQNIIFLGDYVYHFAYDRNALLQLYKLFLQLFDQGKNVYILAGNHDRLGNSFVFEEAQKAFNVLLHERFREITQGKGKIHFITQPLLETIENETILFLPFFLPNQTANNTSTTDYKPQSEYTQAINGFATLLQKSNHKNEIHSGYINALLAQYIDQHPQLTIIHHYYINATAFPGQKSKFGYKDIALHESILDMPTIRLISGHLHQPFTHNNYLCTGSVRSTSSLEINQNKYVFQYSTHDKQVQAIPLMINPQVSIKTPALLTQSLLEEELQRIDETNKKYFSSPLRNIVFPEQSKPNISNISLTLNVEHIDYDKIDEFIDPALRQTCKDIRLKKDIGNLESLLQNFTVDSDTLQGFNDRKNILQEYMQKKFGNEYPKYEKVLKELKLL